MQDGGNELAGVPAVDKFDIFPNNSRNGAQRNDGIARLNPSLRCASFRLLFELVDGLGVPALYLSPPASLTAAKAGVPAKKFAVYAIIGALFSQPGILT